MEPVSLTKPPHLTRLQVSRRPIGPVYHLLTRHRAWFTLWYTPTLYPTEAAFGFIKDSETDPVRLLDAAELTDLCHQYNDLLNEGFHQGYAIDYEYETNDCLFIDNLAVAHRAAPEAHLPAKEQGLRIMHRSTIQAIEVLQPRFGLPIQLDIYSPSPLGDGVWQPGGIGFRWDEAARMQN